MGAPTDPPRRPVPGAGPPRRVGSARWRPHRLPPRPSMHRRTATTPRAPASSASWPTRAPRGLSCAASPGTSRTGSTNACRSPAAGGSRRGRSRCRSVRPGAWSWRSRSAHSRTGRDGTRWSPSSTCPGSTTGAAWWRTSCRSCGSASCASRRWGSSPRPAGCGRRCCGSSSTSTPPPTWTRRTGSWTCSPPTSPARWRRTTTGPRRTSPLSPTRTHCGASPPWSTSTRT